MDPFFEAVSLYRRRKYDLCIEVCNSLLQNNPNLMGPWELKMNAMTQRVYIDDIEADDGVTLESDLDTSAMATAPKPGTSLRISTAGGDTTFGNKAGGRPRTSTGRPVTGMVRY